jgi:hypothetical protein
MLFGFSGAKIYKCAKWRRDESRRQKAEGRKEKRRKGD